MGLRGLANGRVHTHFHILPLLSVLDENNMPQNAGLGEKKEDVV